MDGKTKRVAGGTTDAGDIIVFTTQRTFTIPLNLVFGLCSE